MYLGFSWSELSEALSETSVVQMWNVAVCQELNIVAALQASSEADMIFGHLVEMAILVTRLVVEFAKHLPGFQTISKDDQIALLKVGYSVVMVNNIQFIPN